MVSFSRLYLACAVIVSATAADNGVRRKRQLISIDLEDTVTDTVTEIVRDLKAKDGYSDYDSYFQRTGSKSEKKKDRKKSEESKGIKERQADSMSMDTDMSMSMDTRMNFRLFRAADDDMSMSMPNSRPTGPPPTTPTSPTSPPVPVDPPSVAPVAPVAPTAPPVAPAAPTDTPVAPVVAPVVAPTAPSVPPVAPTTPDQCADGTSRDEFVREALSDITPLAILLDPATPQGKAFEWLVTADLETDVCTYATLESRYSMATLYYSTDGDNWTSSTNWISSLSECNWEFVLCDDDEQVTHLSLGKLLCCYFLPDCCMLYDILDYQLTCMYLPL